MAEITRTGSAVWTGDLKSGTGQTSTGSGALRDAAYSCSARFEDAAGTNPEELIAAAHASCFSMALSKVLAADGLTPRQIRTTATLTMIDEAESFKITKVHLATKGSITGGDAAAFQGAAEKAKANCPVSKLLAPGLEAITLEAKLIA